HAKIHAAFLLLLTNQYGDGDVAPDANPFYLHGRSERGAGTDAHVTATPEGTHAVHLAVHVAEPAVTPRRAFSWWLTCLANKTSTQASVGGLTSSAAGAGLVAPTRAASGHYEGHSPH